MTRIHFDLGTAYDLFISLLVLHHPADFGLRPSWAAGVRSRIPAPQREFFEGSRSFLLTPFHWLHGLPPATRNAGAVLTALRQVPPAQRLPRLAINPETPSELAAALQAIAANGKASRAEREILKADLQKKRHSPPPDALETIVSAWSDPAAFGDTYLEALEAYYAAFFAEEEARIAPALQSGLNTAQALAGRLPLDQLVERLSRGVQIESLMSVDELVLVPSYWSSPLIFFQHLGVQQALLVFGCRPQDQSLVPGDQVPAALLSALKALSDPTRLRILRYLAGTPLTPGQLASRLRLRAPTVIHHLNALRLAGLVQINLHNEGERRYALRQEALELVTAGLLDFLQPGDEDVS